MENGSTRIDAGFSTFLSIIRFLLSFVGMASSGASSPTFSAYR
jgi:hypothetical protein